MNEDIPEVFISVYLFSGRVFEYTVKDRDAAGKAREHCDAIVRSGYRHCIPGVLTYYPPHQISKVIARGPEISPMYNHTERGT